MFSGLTNQVSNWMGKKPEDGSEAEAGAAGGPEGADAAAAADAPPLDPTAGSPTKGTSKLEMLAGVKSQVASSMSGVSGWLSGGIPGLNRGGAAESSDPSAQAPSDPSAQSDSANQPSAATEHVKDDDASSATGGADSGPGSLGGTPTEDKDGQQPFGAVSTKALAGAKSFGGFLYSAVNKAGKSVVEASVKIKKTVEENRLIAELNKEQEAFIAGKPGEKGEAVAPWVGAPNEDALREECLTLSTDRRNFVRAPPPGVDFAWDFEAVQPMAQATLALDPNLETMRFELVPKVISEENFWRNYFYRVSLLRQSHEMKAMANESTENNPSQALATSDVADPNQASPTSEPRKGSSSGGSGKETTTPTTPAADKSTEETRTGDEVKDDMAKLALQTNKEEDWERELEAELKDYEVVPGQTRAKDDWDDDGQIDELLKDDEDLK